MEYDEVIKIKWSPIMTLCELEKYKDLMKGGVYLWFFEKRIIYVGKADCFRDRFKQHIANVLGSAYWIFDIEDMRGKDPYDILAEQNMMDKKNRHGILFPVDSFSIFLDRDRLTKNYMFLKNTKFSFGECTPDDKKKYSEIEGGITNYLAHKFNLGITPDGRSNNWIIGSVSKYPTKTYKLVHYADWMEEKLNMLPDMIP